MNRPLHLLVCVLLSSTPLAAHEDVHGILDDNRLATADPRGLPLNVFEGDLTRGPIPGFTTDPGFNSDSLNPGSLLGFQVESSLLFSDGLSYDAPPKGEYLDLILAGRTISTVTGDSGSQPAINFAQVDGAGQLHAHLGFFAKYQQWTTEDPLNNPISVGAYVLILRLTSNVHESSEPFAIVFNSGLPKGEFERIVKDVHFLLVPDCPGDLDGDFDVDLSDLGAVLTAYGVSSDGDLDGDGDTDLADLGSVLATYGLPCP